jgi:hypothetical protein
MSDREIEDLAGSSLVTLCERIFPHLVRRGLLFRVAKSCLSGVEPMDYKRAREQILRALQEL